MRVLNFLKRFSISFDEKLTPIVFIFIAFVYIIFSFEVKGSPFVATAYAYYTDLLNALLHFRLNVNPATTIDISIFNGKYYLNWGPAPVLFIIPFYFLFGTGPSDVFYTLAAGFFNVVLFYFLIKEFRKYFSLNLSKFSEIFILFTFAFASPNFYLSMGGRVWHTEQVVATFYVLAFLLFFFKYLNRGFKNIYLFILSVIFFNLAWFSRATMVFYGIFFFFSFYLTFKERKVLLKQMLYLSIITAIFILTFLGYNYARFNNPFETGLNYHNVNPRYEEALANKKIFSFSYIPHNINQYFLTPAFITFDKPYINLNLDGNSVFSVYPVFIIALFLFRNKILGDKKINRFLLTSFLVIFLNLGLLMTYFATGWTEVGSRYVLDIIPLISLLCLFVVEDLPQVFLVFILFYTSIICTFGSFFFNYY